MRLSSTSSPTESLGANKGSPRSLESSVVVLGRLGCSVDIVAFSVWIDYWARNRWFEA